MNAICFKILLLGDDCSKKASLLSKYVGNNFPEYDLSTIGFTSQHKIIKINDIGINLQIYDIKGQQYYRTISQSYLRNIDGIMFVYDITNKSSFDLLKYWLIDKEIYSNCKYIIVGNKCHKEHKRQVTREMLENFCSKNGIKGIEVSSKLGTNISESFEMLAKLIVGNRTKEELINLYNKKEDQLNLSKKELEKENKKSKKHIKNLPILNQTDYIPILSLKLKKNYANNYLSKYIKY